MVSRLTRSMSTSVAFSDPDVNISIGSHDSSSWVVGDGRSVTLGGAAKYWIGVGGIAIGDCCLKTTAKL